jgi:hypothetical protein
MLRAPASVLKYNGKNSAMKTTKITAALPSPNHRIASGIHAMPGIGNSARMTGSTNSRTARMRPTSSPSGIAKAAATAKPETARTKLDARCS